VSTALDRWTLATTAAAALAVNPEGLHGLVVRDRPGPVRDGFLAVLESLLHRPVLRVPGSLDQRALSPGLDLGETLRMGKEVRAAGLIERAAGRVLLIPMAERIEVGTAAGFASVLDGTNAPAMVLLDEGAEPDEAAHDALTDRLAMQISLEGMASSAVGSPAYGCADVQAARLRLEKGVADGDAVEVLSRLALSFGIGSLRAPLLALKLSRTLAALRGASAIEEADISMTALLCLAPRATVLPAPEDQSEETPPAPQDDPEQEAEQTSTEQGPLEDRVLDAIAATLPDLNLTGAKQRGGANASGAGDRKKSASHGRPVRSRPGSLDGKRLDVFATLLTAAPWQPLRRRASPDRRGLIVVPSDFQIKQYDRPAESVLIFLVDASGSQAAARMAEAKGAVELMLAEAYRRREKVALICFRKQGAELILPPTRSLLQAKRRLAVLPGGGPTPLAAALVAGRELAHQVRRRGATPYIVALTDGRGNIALDGEANRGRATEDQTQAARAIAMEGIACVLIDTANRPQADAKALAKAMDAQYLPLPRADSKGISRIVRAGLAA